MSDCICPYCDFDNGTIDDCYEQEETYRTQCEKCNKYFVFTVDYIRCYSESKADCLNGLAEHNLKEIVGFPKEYFENKRRCSMCNKLVILEVKK